ncbi:hypothetical protein BDY19DRAFT_107722 [Irpex rosettiformis]|uniref:Uncharacterized protein n=1 Tax=Irpex rosettiformis TaxID=378272 RepID=A0ACB8U5G4_9APHY|nr:hypothetical protein BDY19DRAFT_107722 [Irpex rosettiformis]
MPRTIEDLPPELICSVLEELAPSTEPYSEADALDWLQTYSAFKHDELASTQDIAACALVCRTWHEIALPLLFHTLRLQVTPEGRGKGLGDALTWLKTVPWICSCVKDVHFMVPMAEAFASDLPDDDSQYYNLVLLCDVLQMFPRLQEVAMQDILLKPYASQAVAPPKHALNLNRFSFIFRHRSPFDMCVTDLLCLFPWLGSVKRVSLQRLFGVRPSLPLVKAPIELHIESLDLSSVTCIHSLTQLLVSTPSFRIHGLRSLSLNLNAIPGRFDEGDIVEFLTLVAPRLEEFHCNVGWFIARESPMSSLVRSWKLHSDSALHPLSLAARRDIRLDLSGFVALKKLRLMFYAIGDFKDEENRADMLAVANILSTLVENQSLIGSYSLVEDITLSLVLDDWLHDPGRRDPGKYLASTCAVELIRIQDVVTRLSMVKRFRIARHGHRTRVFGEEDQAALKSAFPMLEERGVLFIN